jgi:hypothetical protein
MEGKTVAVTGVLHFYDQNFVFQPGTLDRLRAQSPDLFYLDAVTAVTPDESPASESQLMAQVGKKVTLSGKFSLYGKMAYIDREPEPVYLLPGDSFGWSPEYRRMEGKTVNITGTLRLIHFENPNLTNQSAVPIQVPPDRFFFDASTANVTPQ